jgi:hypothetical protein
MATERSALRRETDARRLTATTALIARTQRIRIASIRLSTERRAPRILASAEHRAGALPLLRVDRRPPRSDAGAAAARRERAVAWPDETSMGARCGAASL